MSGSDICGYDYPAEGTAGLNHVVEGSAAVADASPVERILLAQPLNPLTRMLIFVGDSKEPCNVG